MHILLISIIIRILYGNSNEKTSDVYNYIILIPKLGIIFDEWRFEYVSIIFNLECMWPNKYFEDFH